MKNSQLVDTNKLNIIALAGHLTSKRGGLELSLFDSLCSLSERGHSITLVYEEEGNQLNEYRRFCDELVKINSYRLNKGFLPDILKISVKQNSVVYSNQYDNLFFAFSLSALRKVPLVAHHRLEASTECNRLKIWKQRITLAGIHRHIAVSNAVKNDWVTKLDIKPELVDVVYNGIDPQIFQITHDLSSLREKWGISVGRKIISYVGRLENYKGIETLIRSFDNLLKSGVQADLLVAGKPIVSGESYVQYLKDLVTDLGIDSHVKFLGHITNVVELYHVSDIVVIPSEWLEAFGRVVIEAMACGTPVIGSEVGGIPEILTDEFSSWLFEPGNQESLLQTLSKVINLKQSDPDISKLCKEHISKNFKLEKAVDGIEKVLLKTIKAE